MKDKINITVRLADQPPIAMHDVSLAEEETIRRAEFNINRLWESWRQRFRDKTSAEVLAMVTLRFAQLYYSHLERLDALDELLAGFEHELDSRLIAIGGSDATAPDAHATTGSDSDDDDEPR